MNTSIIVKDNTNDAAKFAFIQSKIYEIRGRKVMLDFELAKIYEDETRVLKQAVRRNIERFPADFMFQLTKEEWNELIANCDNLQGSIKYSPATPLALTLEGVCRKQKRTGKTRTPIGFKQNNENK